MEITIPAQKVPIPDPPAPTPPYDDTALISRLNSLEDRIEALEKPPIVVPPPPPTTPSGRFFADTAFQYAGVQQLPKHSNSDALVQELYAQVKLHGGNINASKWSNGLYYADASSPITPVFLVKQYEENGAVGTELKAGVRIPAGFKSAMGGDGHGCIIDPIAKKEYDFFQLRFKNNRWECSDAGILPLGGNGILKRLSVWNSATASHLPLSTRVISKKELEADFCDHMIGLAIYRPKKGTAKPPASTTDGWYTGPNALQEGQILRAPANIVIDSAWPPIVKLLIKTLRDKGCFIPDKTGAGASFYVQDPTQFGLTDSMLAIYCNGMPQYKIFGDANNPGIFPWLKLEAVQ